MSRKLFALVTVLFAAQIFALHAQEEVIKVNTTLVSVPVIVSDRQGRYIPGLKSSDFSLFSDGTQRNIDFFASTEETINVALLIDTSHSTQPVIDDIKSAAKRFVKLLRPTDKAAVISFDYSVNVLSHFTSDPEKLNKAIHRAEIPEPFGTTLRDAVYQTVNDEFAGLSGRKAIILLTDGKDVGSSISMSNLLYSLQEKDVMIYSVFFKTGPQAMQQMRRGGMGRRGGVFGGRFPGNDPFPDRQRGRQQRATIVNERAEDFLNELSDTTAGRFYASDASKFKETFDLIVDELRHQYRLGFYPPDEKAVGLMHDIKVKVSRPDTAVRTRSFYRAAANK